MSTKVTTQPVAKSVPFDNTTASFKGTEVQTALEEVRRRIVWDLNTQATTLNGTETLVEADDSMQVYTGTATGYSIVLPDATTLFQGRKFELANESSQPILVKTNGGATLFSLSQNSIGYVTLKSNGTAAGQWIHWQIFVGVAGGIVNYNVTSTTGFTSNSTTDVIITGFTVTPTAGTYAVLYNASVQNTSGTAFVTHTVYKNGVAVADTTRVSSFNSSNRPVVIATQSVIQFNGSETCDVRVRTSAASQTVNGRSLLLIRLGG